MKRIFACACLLFAGTALAQDLAVGKAWVRGTVPGQNATGAFMQITAKNDAALLGATSPVAKSVEIHEMGMDGNVMKMRQLPSLELPAGKTVELKPGGYHLMLVGLAQPLKKGDTVAIELKFQGKEQKSGTIKVSAEVRELGAPAMMEGHEHHHQH